MSNSPKAFCPVQGCDYWIVFGGYFGPFIKGLYKHFKTHTELSWGDGRVPGGMLDQRLGNAVVTALRPKMTNDQPQDNRVPHGYSSTEMEKIKDVFEEIIADQVPDAELEAYQQEKTWDTDADVVRLGVLPDEARLTVKEYFDAFDQPTSSTPAWNIASAATEKAVAYIRQTEVYKLQQQLSNSEGNLQIARQEYNHLKDLFVALETQDAN